MKRKLFVLSLLLVLLAALLVPAGAETLDYVTDSAGLLTGVQQQILESRAEEISGTYDLGIYVIAVDDFTRYSTKPEIYDARVELFDIYRSDAIGAGKKSMAFTLHFAPENKALEPADVDRLVKKILGNLKFKLGIEIR